MNVGQIKAYVASLVDDLQMTYFTPTELLRYINQEMRETQKKLIAAGNNWYIKIDESQSTVVNQLAYTVPTDFLKFNRIELCTNINTTSETRYNISSITLNQKDMMFAQSDTTCFYLLKNTLYLTPQPKTIRTIRMYYTYLIAEVAIDADIPDVPPEYHEYIAMLVAAQCFLKDGRDAGFILNKTKMVEEALKADAIERNQDHASTVVICDNDSLSY